MNNTRAGNAHIQHALRLSHTVKCPGHKGIVLYRVGKNHDFGAAHTAITSCEFRCSFDDPAHFCHGIHVKARLGGADVHAGADPLCGCHGFRDRADQLPVSGGCSLLYKR